MTIIGIDNQRVEIKITSYQFPKTSKYEEDRNWLNVFLKVESNQGNWETIDPALTTSDLIEIKNWFEQILKNGKPKENNLDFIEPNLSFEFLDNLEQQNLIRVIFDLEFRPVNYKEVIDYYVDFEATQKNIEKLITEIDSQIVNYPIRK